MTRTILIPIVGLFVFLTSCSSEKEKQEDIVNFATVWLSDTLTVQDSMLLIYNHLQEDFEKMTTKYREFNLNPHTKSTFAYADTLGKVTGLEIHPLIPWAELSYMAQVGKMAQTGKVAIGKSYRVMQLGERFVLHTSSGNVEDSLSLHTPEQLERALLPLRMSMSELQQAALRAQREHGEKLDLLVSTASSRK